MSLLELAKRDVTDMTDEELDSLVEKKASQNGLRTRNVGTRSGSGGGGGGGGSAVTLFGVKSWWLAAAGVLLVAFVIMFTTNESDINNTSVDRHSGKGGSSENNNLTKAPSKTKKPLLEEDEDRLDKPEAGADTKDETADGATAHDTSESAKDLDDTKNDAEETTKDESEETKMEVETKTVAEDTTADTTKSEPTTTSSVSVGGYDKDKESEEARKAGRRPRIPYLYKRRSSRTGDKTLQSVWAKERGSWNFADPNPGKRPKDDYCGGFPNRDIPWDKFPDGAWQTDSEYLSKFLPEAKDLVMRAIEAILSEYGFGKEAFPDLSWEERIDKGPFKTEILNLTDSNAKGSGDLGGWVTQSYMAGLVRRSMHSIITGDTFTLVMGGHSAAAGHGNHFVQSYTLQVQKTMEPVFARLGVRHKSHNMGFGGLGTAQNFMGSGDLYGREIDMLLWDSSMTEPSDPAYDVYLRQAVLAGKRIPVFLGGMGNILKALHVSADVEVGMFGTGVGGVQKIVKPNDAYAIPWAARYMSCDGELKQLCKDNEFNGTCWIEREDWNPTWTQSKEPGGRASWHPGFRYHQAKGRIISINLLRAMHTGLTMWDEAPDKKLPESVWHVTDHYEHIRTKVRNLDREIGACYKYKELPDSYCTTPYRGYAEMTRVFPAAINLRELMKPAGPDKYIPQPIYNAYDPPDIYNPTTDVPPGEFDYVGVVENGIEYSEFITFDNAPPPPKYENKLIPVGVEGVVPGLGWDLNTLASPDLCDGSFDSFCGRSEGNNCLLYGACDNRGGLGHDSFSGWGVFTLHGVRLGVIIARIEWWHESGTTRTVGWTTENNGTDPTTGRRLQNIGVPPANQVRAMRHVKEKSKTRRVHPPGSGTWLDMDHNDGEWLYVNQTRSSRRLKKKDYLCKDFKFEFAVNGKKTTYDKKQWEENLIVVERVVQVQYLLNETDFVKGGDPVDVEVAMRILGCERTISLWLSSLYWA